MSLVKLLTQYPNYSARRVRRLATQIAYLEAINSKEAKGIADDLMAFNLLEAQRAEARDECEAADAAQERPALLTGQWKNPIPVPNMVPKDMATELYGEQGKDWVYLESFDSDKYHAERKCVTPVSQAYRALDLIVEDQRARHNEIDLCKLATAKGYINGTSFYTDHCWSRESEAKPA